MLVHRLGIDRRHDDGRADTTLRADGAEQMCGVVAIVLHHERATADRCPDVGMGAFLAHAGFILIPDLDWQAAGDRAAEQRGLHQAGEVFLKASWAAASCFG